MPCAEPSKEETCAREPQLPESASSLPETRRPEHANWTTIGQSFSSVSSTSPSRRISEKDASKQNNDNHLNTSSYDSKKIIFSAPVTQKRLLSNLRGGINIVKRSRAPPSEYKSSDSDDSLSTEQIQLAEERRDRLSAEFQKRPFANSTSGHQRGVHVAFPSVKKQFSSPKAATREESFEIFSTQSALAEPQERPHLTGRLLDEETFQALGHFDVDYAYHVPILRPRIGLKPVTPAAKIVRYFKRHKKDSTPALSAANEVPVSFTEVAEAKRNCNESPTCADAWLRASQLENAVHVAGLSRKDRLNRRIAILKEGLSYCAWDIELLLELLKIAELRELSVVVEYYYESLIAKVLSSEKSSSTPVKEAPKECEEDVLSLLRQEGRVPLDPRLLLRFLEFLQHSLPRFSCSRYFDCAVEFYDGFAPSCSLSYAAQKCLKPRRFDQTVKQICAEQLTALQNVEPILCSIGCTVLKTLMHASQWPLVGATVQALSHLDFQLNCFQSSGMVVSSENIKTIIIPEVLAFWTSKAPRVGNPLATALYLTLYRTHISKTQTSSYFNLFLNDKKFCYDELSVIVDAVLEAMIRDVQGAKEGLLKLSSNVDPFQWFEAEMRLDELHWAVTQSNDVDIGYEPRSESIVPPTAQDGCSIHFHKPAQIAFFLHAFSINTSSTIVRHRLFDTLGYPWVLARLGSNDLAYTSSVVSSESDVLLALISGVERKVALTEGFHCSVLNSFDQRGITTESVKTACLSSVDAWTEDDIGGSLLLVEVFGYNLGGTTSPDISFFFSVAGKVLSVLRSKRHFSQDTKVLLNTRDIQQHLNVEECNIRSRFVTREMVGSVTCTALAAQMLTWATNDILLLMAVIGFLAYTQQPKLARSLLKLHDAEPAVWASFILFNFAAKPSCANFYKSRTLLVRVVSAMDLLPKKLYFLSALLRVEFLGLITLRKELARHKPEVSLGLTDDALPVASSVLQLLCCAVEGSFEAWSAAFAPDAPLSSVHTHTLSWDLHQLPSRTRMVAAQEVYASRLRCLTEGAEAEVAATSSSSSSLPILVPSFFVALLGTCIITAALSTPEAAWNKFQEFVPPVPQPQPREEQKVLSKRESYDVEVVLDLLLLAIVTASPVAGSISNSWSTPLVNKITDYVLFNFPSHHRASWLSTQLHCYRGSLVRLRCALSPTVVSLRCLVTSELTTGFPCYRRLEHAFENALLHHDLKTNPYTWDLYLFLLYLVDIFGPLLFTALPAEDSGVLRSLIRTKISAVCQRARYHCPYSKRLWLHMLFSLRMLPTSDELLEDKFLDELELVCKKEIVCRLDPLLLLANISTKATKI